ncbi:hypothetical protein ACFLQR_03465, partial [Verrucomicrobiota bacterium]
LLSLTAKLRSRLISSLTFLSCRKERYQESFHNSIQKERCNDFFLSLFPTFDILLVLIIFEQQAQIELTRKGRKLSNPNIEALNPKLCETRVQRREMALLSSAPKSKTFGRMPQQYRMTETQNPKQNR